MIRHLLKIVWNRRKANLLIALEIFVSFLVLFSVAAVGVYYWDNYRKPLGFTWQSVWILTVDTKTEHGPKPGPAMMENYRQVMHVLGQFPEVDVCAGADNVPYSHVTMNSMHNKDGRQIEFSLNEATDRFNEVLGLKLTRGRWFEPSDDGLNWRPMVVNERFARETFGDDDPIGKKIDETFDNRESRIVGVIADFRKDGEFSGLEEYAFYREDLKREDAAPPRFVVFKTHAGTSQDFEERLMAKLNGTVREWSFEIQTLAEMREGSLRVYLAPVITSAIVSGSMMLMVGLGLVGVLWQSVTQRTREIGLRRAKGAAKIHIYVQILGELLIITSIGLALGLALILQFPLLNLLGFLNGRVYFYSIGLSMGLIYLLTLLCGLYPSHLASRIYPAEALHYE